MAFGNMQPPPSGNETPVDKVWRDSSEDNITRKLPGVTVNSKSVQNRLNRETVQTSTHKGGSTQEPVFLYKGLLLYSLICPFAIMLAFGGRPALLVFCFGSLITYIFDLLGTIEGTLMAILISGLGLWATMVWSARIMLAESFLNFPLIVVMGILLMGIFIIICGHFKSLLYEFESSFYYAEVVLFSSIPLLSSVIITWFLCVEFPYIDLSLCFSTVYFLHTLWICKPRLSSHPSAIDTTAEIPIYTIPTNIMTVVYSIPIILSPLFYMILHHNVLFDSYYRMNNFLSSILAPLLYMIICVEHQLEYFPMNKHKSIANSISMNKMIFSILLFLCTLNHPLLSDLKAVSGVGEPLISFIMIGAGIFGFLAIYIHRLDTIKMYMKDYQWDQYEVRSARIADARVSICIAGCALLVGFLLGMPVSSLSITVTGAFSAADFYRRPMFYTWSTCPKIIAGIFPVLMMMLATMITLVNFTSKTLLFMTFSFDWAVMPMNLQQFCARFWFTSCLAVAVPALAMGLHDDSDRSAREGITDYEHALEGTLPGGVSMGLADAPDVVAKLLRDYVKPLIFNFAFLYVIIVISAAELVIREQDWSSVNVGADSVYPGFLLAGSGLISMLTSMHLFNIDKIGRSTMWVVIVIQGSKLLHMADVSTHNIIATVQVLLSYTVPFLIHSNLEGLNFALPVLCGVYLCIGIITTYFARVQLLHDVLVGLTMKDPTEVQQLALALAMWFTYASLLISHFFKTSSAAIRSVLLFLAVMSTLVASRALPLSFEIDPNSPTYLIVSLHPDLAENHNAVFLLLSSLLLVSAAINVIPVKQAIPRLLFLIVFSYCSARALLGWCFPLSLNNDSPQHGILQLPWLYCICTSFLASSTSVHSGLSSKPKDTPDTPVGSVMFVCFACLPFGALAWTLIEGTLHENYQGILWTAAVSNGFIAVSTRAAEISREIKGLRGLKDASSMSVCMLSTVSGIFWTAIASVLTHTVSSDVTIPLSCLLLLTLKRNLIYDIHPLALAGLVSSIWWIISAIYSIFIKGYSSKYLSNFEINVGIFGVENVSFWNNDTLWFPLLQLLLLLVPIPAVYLGYLRRKDDSEDVMFILALLSVLSVVGSGCSAIRLIGVSGVVFASYRCYDIGQKQVSSNRLI